MNNNNNNNNRNKNKKNNSNSNNIVNKSIRYFYGNIRQAKKFYSLLRLNINAYVLNFAISFCTVIQFHSAIVID